MPSAKAAPKPRFFRDAAGFATWLHQHHTRKNELLVGFHKVASGKPSITYQEALDLALAHGWIDGVRKSLGKESYTIRFTPRRARSIWSLINIKRVKELTSQGLMKLEGLAAFEQRDPKRSARYAYEQEKRELDEASATTFKANKKAWAYFQTTPPSYRRTVSWWVINAKKEETRLKRLSILIDASEKKTRLDQLSPKAKP